MTYNEIVTLLKNNNLLKDCTNVDLDINDISYDSRSIKENTLFVCKGLGFKEDYLNDSIKNGAI